MESESEEEEDLLWLAQALATVARARQLDRSAP